MHTQHTFVDERGNVEIVEHINTELPHVCILILMHAFLVETIGETDLPRLMVTAKQRDVVRPSVVAGRRHATQYNTLYPTNKHKKRTWLSST